MADQRTMAQLLQAPIEGYEDAIVVPAITANNFKLKHGLITLVQNKQLFECDKEDPHAHHFDESFSEAWDRFKDLLRACPHHCFSELHQLDTFYNTLNSKDQDSLNSTAGGNFLDKMPCECLTIIESKSKVHYSRNKLVVAKVSMNTSTSGISPDVAELKDTVKALLLDKKNQNQSLVPVKAVEESCVTCGAYVKVNDTVMRNMQTQGQNMQNQLTNLNELITKFVNFNSASTSSSGTLPSNTSANPRSDLKAITNQNGVSYDGPQIPPSTTFLPKVVENKPEATKDIVRPTNNESTEDVQPQDVHAPKPIPKSLILYPSRRNDERNREKANNQIEKFYQIFKDMSFKISFADALILMPKFALTLKALIRNKEKLSEMARTSLNEHCSAVLLKKLPEMLEDPCKFLIPCDFPTMAECLALADLGASNNLMLFSVWKILSLPDLTPTCMTLELADRLISHLVGVVEDVYVKTGRALIDVLEGELTLRVGKEAITFNLDQTSRYLTNYSDMKAKRIDSYLDPEGDVLLLEAFLNDDPSSPPPTQGNCLPKVRKELKICEAKSDKSSIDEPPEVALKDLPPYLEYAFLEGDNKFPVIIAKDLSVEEKTAPITVLKSHKRTIAWELSDIKGIDPEFCTHKFLWNITLNQQSNIREE
nr:reverse transcriptase domain-containing protein [Tanacetum cinerariifolium]